MPIKLARLALLASLAFASIEPAHAAQRTFVSTSGSDANPCSVVAPCRSFGQAIAATDTSGEIIVLDSGGYGRVTIDKSVTIQAPPGVYAGISVFPGTNGIDITTAGVEVALRGLTINGQDGQDGISVSALATLDIEGCTIAHMTRYGIYANIDGANLSVKDSSIHDNGNAGVRLIGDLRFRFERVGVKRNGGYGINAQDVATGSIADSVIAGNSDTGLQFGNQTNGATMALVLSGSRIHSNGLSGVVVGTGMPGTLKFEASENVISDNAVFGVVVSASVGGTVVATLRGNTVAHNGNSGVLVNSLGATLNVADNVIVGNDGYGLQQSTNGVLNTLGNNVVRDNDSGATLGLINVIGGV